MTRPGIKGWCPGAHRPMMSGDGLIVRVRPRGGRLTARSVCGLADLAGRIGNGSIDLTNRGNLQLRGVRPEDHQNLLVALDTLGLLDTDPEHEARRNVLVTPIWSSGDRTQRICAALDNALETLPPLPAKVGFVVDTAPVRVLNGASGDIRIETAETGGLIVRADGLATGRPVSEADVCGVVHEMALWLSDHLSTSARRMATAVAAADPPNSWVSTYPGPYAPLQPGRHELGFVLGAPFGHMPGPALVALLEESQAPALRLASDRLFLLEKATEISPGPFVASPGDPLLTSDACPGAPFCPQATVETRTLARTLALRFGGNIHVSGCAKGCARPRPASQTMVGRDGRFDLVEDGCSWDEPSISGLTPDAAARLNA